MSFNYKYVINPTGQVDNHIIREMFNDIDLYLNNSVVTNPLTSDLALGGFDLTNNSNIVFSPNSDGSVNKPNQPAFFVAPSSTASNVTGDNTIYTVTWGNESFDVGGNFSSNTFTAPVDGQYLFIVVLDAAQLSTANHSTTQLAIVTPGVNHTIEYSDIPSSLDRERILNTAVINLDANDTVTVTFRVEGSSKVVDVNASGLALTRWYGTLIN